MAEIVLYLIRHGKTPGNAEKRYIGRTDESLSGEGKAEVLRRAKDYPEVDILFSSPMLRCKESCDLIYPEMKSHEIEELKEIDFGAYEGKNYLDLADDPRYQDWVNSNGVLPFPEGENRNCFILRSIAGFRKMMDYVRNDYLKEKGTDDKNALDGLKVAAIVHGGTIMAVLSGLCGGAYYDYQVSNCDGYECHVALDNDEYYFKSVHKL